MAVPAVLVRGQEQFSAFMIDCDPAASVGYFVVGLPVE